MEPFYGEPGNAARLRIDFFTAALLIIIRA